MPRKYIRLCLSSSELDCIIQAEVKLNQIAHQAISNWETINPEQQKQLMRDRQIFYIKEPLKIKIIGADRTIATWLTTKPISNESLTLSTAIGLILLGSLPAPPLILPSELADKLQSIGGDPVHHLQLYLINRSIEPTQIWTRPN
jgi:hypothetical protein